MDDFYWAKNIGHFLVREVEIVYGRDSSLEPLAHEGVSAEECRICGLFPSGHGDLHVRNSDEGVWECYMADGRKIDSLDDEYLDVMLEVSRAEGAETRGYSRLYKDEGI